MSSFLFFQKCTQHNREPGCLGGRKVIPAQPVHVVTCGTAEKTVQSFAYDLAFWNQLGSDRP